MAGVRGLLTVPPAGGPMEMGEEQQRAAAVTAMWPSCWPQK